MRMAIGLVVIALALLFCAAAIHGGHAGWAAYYSFIAGFGIAMTICEINDRRRHPEDGRRERGR